mmetsp:Transcript_32798/g.68737  ORF Transcript_32798/g.68737 Transcript_32798/m.68737 type:complete len:82 (+) Transcript_32798:507-752(+)
MKEHASRSRRGIEWECLFHPVAVCCACNLAFKRSGRTGKEVACLVVCDLRYRRWSHRLEQSRLCAHSTLCCTSFGCKGTIT